MRTWRYAEAAVVAVLGLNPLLPLWVSGLHGLAAGYFVWLARRS